MRKITVLRLVDKKKSPHNKIKRTEYETHSLITARSSRRAIRKLVKKNQDEIVIINHNCKEEYVLENYKKYYNELSTEAVLSVIDKICRETTQKYNLKLPLEEVYLYAKPSVAYKFIEKLIGISRIFTVVTSEPSSEEADKLYFEYGCLIRHIHKSEINEPADTLTIYIEKGGISFSPIINITTDIIPGERVVDVRKIAVSDKDVKGINDDLCGVNGLVLYTLLEKTPTENAKVDINKVADRIFLLDTKAN